MSLSLFINILLGLATANFPIAGHSLLLQLKAVFRGAAPLKLKTKKNVETVIRVLTS